MTNKQDPTLTSPLRRSARVPVPKIRSPELTPEPRPAKRRRPTVASSKESTSPEAASPSTPEEHRSSDSDFIPDDDAAAPSPELGASALKWQDKWGYNAKIVKAASRLLTRIRGYYMSNPDSELGLREMRDQLQGLAYKHRKVSGWTQELADLPWDVAPVDTGGGDTAEQRGGSKKGKARTIPRAPPLPRNNAQRAATATVKLQAWIDESETVNEAVWVIRALAKVGEEMDGEVVLKWTLCEE